MREKGDPRAFVCVCVWCEAEIGEAVEKGGGVWIVPDPDRRNIRTC